MADYETPDDLYYSTDDEWVRPESGHVVVGITDYAQQQLGDIVFVELPDPGETFDQGDTFGVVESVKAVVDLCAPLGGEIVSVNPNLAERPEIVNDACYGEGWMVALAASDPDELESLLDAEAYRKHVDERGE